MELRRIRRESANKDRTIDYLVSIINKGEINIDEFDLIAITNLFGVDYEECQDE